MNAVNPSGWRPETPQAGSGDAPMTTTGNRALMLEEPLIFEMGSRDQTGVDFDAGRAPAKAGALGDATLRPSLEQ